MTGCRVNINEATGRDLIALAHLRNDPKTRFNAYSEWYNEQAARKAVNSLDNHILGLFGEWAAGQVLGGVDVDRNVYQNHGDNGIADLLLPTGHTVQVKTRARPGYDFALGPKDTTLQSDFAVLCWSCGFTGAALSAQQSSWSSLEQGQGWPRGGIEINVYGYATRHWFAEHAVYRDYGYGSRLVLQPGDFQQVFLRPIPVDLLSQVLRLSGS